MHGEDGHERDRKADDIDERHGDRPERQRQGGVAHADRTRVGAEGENEDVLEDDGDREHGHHLRFRAPFGERLQEIAVDRDRQRGDEERDHRQTEQRVDAGEREEEEARVGADEKKVAMRQVDEAHDAEDDRQAEGGKREHATEQHARHDRA